MYQCNEPACREQFTVTVGTVFERSKIPLTKWLAALFLMTASKKGVSANQTHRILGISYKSTWFLMHRLLEAMRTGGCRLVVRANRRVDFRYNNRIAVGVDDTDRATELAKGIVGKRLTYRRPNSKNAQA